MEETDAILPILLEMGFKYKIPVRSFDTEHLFSACAILLQALGVQNLPLQMPKSNAARFRLCADLASKVQEQGYSGDLGYQSFLYPNPNESRTLLLFLIDRLPKEREEETQEQLAQGYKAKVLQGILRQYAKLWVPQVLISDVPKKCTGDVLTLPFLHGAKEYENKDFWIYIKHFYKDLNNQIPEEMLSSALLYRIDEDLAQQRFQEEKLLKMDGNEKNRIMNRKTDISNAFKASLANLGDINYQLSGGTLNDVFKRFLARKQNMDSLSSNAFSRRTMFEDQVSFQTLEADKVESATPVAASFEDLETKKAELAAALQKKRDEEIDNLKNEIEKYEKGMIKSENLSARAKSEIEKVDNFMTFSLSLLDFLDTRTDLCGREECSRT